MAPQDVHAALATKADRAEVERLDAALQQGRAALRDLSASVATKADAASLQRLGDEVAGKAGADGVPSLATFDELKVRAAAKLSLKDIVVASLRV